MCENSVATAHAGLPYPPYEREIKRKDERRCRVAISWKEHRRQRVLQVRHRSDPRKASNESFVLQAR